MANISQVFGERTLAYKFKRPANPKRDKYKRNHERMLNFVETFSMSNLFFTEMKKK